MRRATRTIAFVLALSVAATAATMGMFVLGRAAYSDTVAVKLSVVAGIGQGTQMIRRLGRSPAVISVAFMGDSTAISYPEGETVHERLDEDLQTRWLGNGIVRPVSLSSLGMTPPGYYLVQDLINDAHPDIAIITANLGLIRSELPQHLRRPELSGWVRARRMYDTLVALDMHEYGVTADRLLLYKLFVALDQTGTWYHQTENQARLGRLREVAVSKIAEETGWEAEIDRRRLRFLDAQNRAVRSGAAGAPPVFTEEGAKRALGQVMVGIDSSHWLMEVLDRLLRDFAQAGTATILYVSPINVEQLRDLGVYDEAGLGRTLATLETIALDNGAEFADLHDLLPDAAFRDTGGHFTHEPPYHGPDLVAQALAPYVTVLAHDIANSR